MPFHREEEIQSMAQDTMRREDDSHAASEEWERELRYRDALIRQSNQTRKELQAKHEDILPLVSIANEVTFDLANVLVEPAAQILRGSKILWIKLVKWHCSVTLSEAKKIVEGLIEMGMLRKFGAPKEKTSEYGLDLWSDDLHLFMPSIAATVHSIIVNDLLKKRELIFSSREERERAERMRCDVQSEDDVDFDEDERRRLLQSYDESNARPEPF